MNFFDRINSKISEKKIIFFWHLRRLLITFSFLNISGCYPFINIENKKQIEITSELIADLKKIITSEKGTINAKLSVLSLYPAQCQLSKPVVPQEHCLCLTIEAGSIEDAQNLAIQFYQEISNSNLTNKYKNNSILLIAAVRTNGFSGRITPAALKNNQINSIAQIYFKI